jgi:hypothetical protein
VQQIPRRSNARYSCKTAPRDRAEIPRRTHARFSCKAAPWDRAAKSHGGLMHDFRAKRASRLSRSVSQRPGARHWVICGRPGAGFADGRARGRRHPLGRRGPVDMFGRGPFASGMSMSSDCRRWCPPFAEHIGPKSAPAHAWAGAIRACRDDEGLRRTARLQRARTHRRPAVPPGRNSSMTHEAGSLIRVPDRGLAGGRAKTGSPTRDAHSEAHRRLGPAKGRRSVPAQLRVVRG